MHFNGLGTEHRTSCLNISLISPYSASHVNDVPNISSTYHFFIVRQVNLSNSGVKSGILK